MNLTYNEQERAAYAKNLPTVPLLAELAEKDAMVEAMEAVDSYLDDARVAYPDEDFLDKIIERCDTMAEQRVTKADMKAIAELLVELQTQIASSVGFGNEALCNARKEIAPWL